MYQLGVHKRLLAIHIEIAWKTGAKQLPKGGHQAAVTLNWARAGASNYLYSQNHGECVMDSIELCYRYITHTKVDMQLENIS